MGGVSFHLFIYYTCNMKYKLIPGWITISDKEIKPPLTSDKLGKAYLKAKGEAHSLALNQMQQILNEEYVKGYEFIREMNFEYVWDNQVRKTDTYFVFGLIEKK
jgi:hypothetical protein